MDQNIQRTGLVNWLLLLIAAGATWLVGRAGGSMTGEAGAAFLGIGFLVALVSWFQMRLYQRERSEKFEYEEILKSKGETSMFAEAAQADTFPAQRSREQFERFFVPFFSVVLFILQGVLTWVLWTRFGGQQPPVPGKATLAMALFALFALILFLLGKYSVRLGQAEELRLVRPGGTYLMLGAVISFAAAATEAAAYFDFKRADFIVARILAVMLGMVAIESLFSLVLEIYRPRVRGQSVRILYESRVIGLLGQPGGLITTAAQALDYQFGFKVSETWVYRFLEGALAWLILLQVLVLGISTCIVVIEPHEQGLLERFGRPVTGRPVLPPGIHAKYPWPIDQVYHFRTRAILSVEVGAEDVEEGTEEHEKERVVLWTKAHFKDEFTLVVASREGVASNAAGEADQAVPVNLVSASIPVQYRITDLQAHVYNHSNASNLLQRIATREVVKYFVNVDVEELMTTGRLKASEALRERIQKESDLKKLGVEILMVGLQDVHPPVKVADAYEAVIGALQEKQTNILFAQAYAAEKLPMAHSEATNLITRAQSDKISKAVSADADASLYLAQLQASRSAPSVYQNRTYLETLSRSVASARKYVIAATNTQDVLQFNLEDKVAPGLLDAAAPPPKK